MQHWQAEGRIQVLQDPNGSAEGARIMPYVASRGPKFVGGGGVQNLTILLLFWCRRHCTVLSPPREL